MAVSLATLNPEQRRAVETLEGPVLVLAGAGTGKTKVLTARLALLLSKGVPPSSLLAVAFTNKAAREMRERAAALVGAAAKGVWLSTFHSLCARILRKEIDKLGWRRDFAIYDESDQESVVRGVLRDLRVPGAQASPEAVLWRIGQAKLRGAGPEAMAESATEEVDHAAARAFEKYQAALKARNAVDFDDLLGLTLRLFREHPGALERYRKQFRYALVDEYQDTNSVQYEIVRALAGARRNLFVVGDDDQAIYGWRGADREHILRFERDFPGAAVIRLERNYRSTEAILAAANAVIARNAARHAKTLVSTLGAGAPVRAVSLYDERAEALWVVDRVRKSGRRASDVAILFRTNAETRPFEEQLRLARIPYTVVGGQRFYDRREVRDLLAYLRVSANPRDDAALARIANVPPRGIGDASMERLGAFAAANRIPLLEAFRRAGEAGVPPAAAQAAQTLAAAFSAWSALAARDPAAGARAIVADLGLAAELRREAPSEESGEARVAAVEGVLSDVAAAAGQGNGLAEYLERIALLDREDPSEEKRDAVTLLTVHAAKGLEFPVVYVTGLADGVFPHRKSAEERSIEEERRLFYVAITRAKEELVFTSPERRVKRGRETECAPSRFLAELPASVVREAPGRRELTGAELDALNAKVQAILAAGRTPSS
jgi:superfamily I DNA/RNA helicase